jgi:OOP family OmpA-OmpF porin
MFKNIINNSAIWFLLVAVFLVSGCACNETWKEGFLKGAAIGGALGGAEGYIVGDDANDDDKNTAIGVGIGGVVGGIIGAFTNRCEETDSDGDGVYDDMDQCPNTPRRARVDNLGCPLDSDRDGVYDGIDQCPNTSRGVTVDNQGCPLDSDGDGVYDDMDECPSTPRGVRVDDDGCPLDSDGDGVYDDMDECPNTPSGITVDDEGCPLDSDRDGIYDDMDQCPGTPEGVSVNEAGCWVLQDVYFDTNKCDIKPRFYPALNEVVNVLNEDPELKIEIQGHTDNTGTRKYNQTLSEKRARAVMEYIIGKGIGEDRLSAVGYGLDRPIADNSTAEGRALNRRTQIEPLY